MRPRWTTAALLVPAIAALALACDSTRPTEVQRPGARQALPSFAYDDNDDNNDGLTAHPIVFVGREDVCAPAPAGHNIVTSAWLGGMGLPDDDGSNSGVDAHLGLILNKNGPTADCSSALARITGVKGLIVHAGFALGFDYRNGSHCSGGSPRFNVVFTPPPMPAPQNRFSFVGGCGNGVRTTAPQDPQWTRVVASATLAGQAFPPIPEGSRIESITIIVDEGTDAFSPDDPIGVGLTVIDNIFVDGRFIRRGRSIAEGRAKGEDNDFDDDGIPNAEDNDDDNDGIPDLLDTDADGDGIEDALAIKLSLPRLPGLGLPDLR